MQDKLRKILKHYGEEVQSKKYIEKLSRLMIAIIKGDIKNIKEEIADVRVMTKQFLMFEWINQQRYKRLRNCALAYYIDLQDGEVEEELQLRILEVQKDIISINDYKELTIAMLEYLLDRYMDINNISKEEIEKEMERKINRQLERIEREKVNK